MNNQSGLMLSEVVTYIMLVLIGASVAFGFYTSVQRDSAVDAAEVSLAEIKLAIDEAEKTGPVTCSHTLVPEPVLENEFLSLMIKPMLISVEDWSQGYGPGVFIESDREKNGGDQFVSAERLMKKLLEESEEGEAAPYLVRMSDNSDDKIAYAVLLSETAVCASSLASLTDSQETTSVQ